MSNDGLIRKLKECGYTLGNLAMGKDGIMRRDAVDSAEGVASL
jgi:hypothetical protein